MITETDLLAVLAQLQISTVRVEHPALLTIEDFHRLGVELPDQGVKNLLLQNRKKNRFYLLTLDERKQADLGSIATQVGESRLSFASEATLLSLLGVGQGSVTPFALLNDREQRVQVLLDEEIKQDELLGFHPIVNTATVCLSYADFLRFLAHSGHSPQWVSMRKP